MQALITNIELKLKYFIEYFVYCSVEELQELYAQYRNETRMSLGKKNSMCRVIESYIIIKRFLSEEGY